MSCQKKFKNWYNRSNSIGGGHLSFYHRHKSSHWHSHLQNHAKPIDVLTFSFATWASPWVLVQMLPLAVAGAWRVGEQHSKSKKELMLIIGKYIRVALYWPEVQGMPWPQIGIPCRSVPAPPRGRGGTPARLRHHGRGGGQGERGEEDGGLRLTLNPQRARG